MSHPSRMDAVHRRVRITRYVIGVAAAGAFAGGAVVVRAAHPGTHGHRSITSASAQAAIPNESSSLQAAADSLTGASSSSSSSGSSVSPAPAASPPVVQSSGS